MLNEIYTAASSKKKKATYLVRRKIKFSYLCLFPILFILLKLEMM